MGSVTAVVNVISSAIINPILALIFAVGVLIFIVGIVEFLLGLNLENKEKSDNGKRHMFWGLIGMTIMLGAISIFNIIARTVCSTDISNCAPITNNSTRGQLNPVPPLSNITPTQTPINNINCFLGTRFCNRTPLPPMDTPPQETGLDSQPTQPTDQQTCFLGFFCHPKTTQAMQY